MELTTDVKRAICSLFEVHADENGVQRVVTPLEYTGSGDRIVVRLRPAGGGVRIDENGEAALYATMGGGDLESEAVSRWIEDLPMTTAVSFDESQDLWAYTEDDRMVAPYIFRVAEAAQQLFAIATSRSERSTSDFKERVGEIVTAVAQRLNAEVEVDLELPIVGQLKADYVLNLRKPLLVIAATTGARLMEAELIHMQYRLEGKPGAVLAIAESQAAVGRKQFERAGYFTDKTVVFEPSALTQLLTQAVADAR